jgi:1-deoxy-D-xylulose-5-phosphate reductoisomerase
MDSYLKGITILGSTGSVGTQTLDVIKTHSGKFKIVGLAANNNHIQLSKQVEAYTPKYITYSGTSTTLEDICNTYQVSKRKLSEIATSKETDLLVVATTGSVSLTPTFEAISSGKNIAIANKEIIIMAGEKLISHAQTHNVNLMPVDSEPSAIWQCLIGEKHSDIDKITITASGGAFRDISIENLETVSAKDSLNHPTWNMGSKITVDSATMMNKAFEVIEAKWLFDVDWDDINVILHPESLVHSFVGFSDGSTKAQISPPDMRLPIQYALFHPERMENKNLQKFNPAKSKNITFKEIDNNRYPCFEMALSYAKKGGTWASALCGADESAVSAFLSEQIGFMEISEIIKSAIHSHNSIESPTLEDLIAAYNWGQEQVNNIL